MVFSVRQTRTRKPDGDVGKVAAAMPLVHGIAAAIFAALGMLTLFNVGKLF
jgi:hypothetical protein